MFTKGIMELNFEMRQGNTGKNMCIWIYILLQSAIVSCADVSYLNDTIRTYFADTRHHDAQFVSYKTRAKEFIFNEFKRFGLEAEYQHFNESGFGDASLTNVIGVKKGNNFGKESDKVLMLLAHYDTVETTKGVDDNGAGVAAILEVARQLHEQKSQREYTLIFISPDVEESGLIGSRHFVQTWLPMWSEKHYGTPFVVGNTTQGCIVLDTVMEYNTSRNSQQVPDPVQTFQTFFPGQMATLSSDNFEGDFLTLIYRKNPDATLAENFRRSWVMQGREQYEIEQFALPLENEIPTGTMYALLQPFLRSDHTNFWMENMPAIFITDTADFRGDMIQCYHNPCDNIEVMLTDENLRFLAKTVDALTNTVNVHSKEIKISKVAGSAGSIVGGVLAVIGFGLSFATFGSSLGLCIAGGVISGAGGVTAGGASIAGIVKAREAKNKAKEQLEAYDKATNEVLIKCSKIAKELEQFGDIGEAFPSWVQFWGTLVLASGQSLAGGWKMIASTIINGVRLGRAANIAGDASSVAGPLARTLGNTAKGVHIAGGVASIIFLPVDVYCLVSNSKELQTGESHTDSKRIREIVKEIKGKRLDAHKIDDMINESIAAL